MTAQYTPKVKVATENCQYRGSDLITNYTYKNTIVSKCSDGSYSAQPVVENYQFKVDLKVPKLGVMLVGLGGNNGSTFIASILANKHKIQFNSKEGTIGANYYGSVTQASFDN